MTCKEMNLRLIATFPELRNAYYEETSWQDGDETGSHVVYEDVFVPFIRNLIMQRNEELLSKVFDYIEALLELNDQYAEEVIEQSVLESLFFDSETQNSSFIKYARKRTAELIEEIAQNR